MAVKFIQQNKKQKYLIIVFIAVILITGVVWWLGFYKGGKISFRSFVSPPPKEVQINFDLFENPEFKALRPFPKILPYPGKAGRANPFLPYY